MLQNYCYALLMSVPEIEAAEAPTFSTIDATSLGFGLRMGDSSSFIDNTNLGCEVEVDAANEPPLKQPKKRGRKPKPKPPIPEKKPLFPETIVNGVISIDMSNLVIGPSTEANANAEGNADPIATTTKGKQKKARKKKCDGEASTTEIKVKKEPGKRGRAKKQVKEEGGVGDITTSRDTSPAPVKVKGKRGGRRRTVKPPPAEGSSTMGEVPVATAAAARQPHFTSYMIPEPEENVDFVQDELLELDSEDRTMCEKWEVLDPARLNMKDFHFEEIDPEQNMFRCVVYESRRILVKLYNISSSVCEYVFLDALPLVLMKALLDVCGELFEIWRKTQRSPLFQRQFSLFQVILWLLRRFKFYMKVV
jgi:hypothetical protein